MQRALPARWIRNSLRMGELSSSTQIHTQVPVFLCPALTRQSKADLGPRCATRCLHDTPNPGTAPDESRPIRDKLRGLSYSGEFSPIRVNSNPIPPEPQPSLDPVRKNEAEEPRPKLAELYNIHTLPSLCHGCGAFAQTGDSSAPGYYDISRNVVKEYLGMLNKTKEESTSKEQEEEVLKSIDTEALAKLGVDISDILPPSRDENKDEKSEDPPAPPLCDRCHNLIHHNIGAPIFHPDVDSLVETILESPYKRNHIYHIIDAADFPMSVLPRMRALEELMPLRGRNRRSQREKWTKGKHMDVSFIITRADLLAPTKEQVSKLLPYLRDVLRDALGRSARDARLGNVRPVSAKDSWWTKEIKEEIWHRGGANWLVGKVNVGKSKFFETIFPKGDRDVPAPGNIEVKVFPRNEPSVSSKSSEDDPTDSELIKLEDALREEGINIQEQMDEMELLPPAHPEQRYPPMPIVSALPGTTAQPIRRPFGKSRGELIDLPGLPRSELDEYVKPEFHSKLILHKRVKPNETTTIKPGQSLLVGGIIRITPREDGPLMLMVNFTPLEEHVTANKKVGDIQTGAFDNPMVEHVGNDEAKNSIRLAGTFQLNTDMTKERAGPLTRKNAVGLKVDRLPFMVLGTDILIEGVGWVEVAAQVRRKAFEGISHEEDSFKAEMTGLPMFPSVDVFSPGGRFIGSRKCMDGFVHNRPKDWGKKLPRRTRSYKGGEEKKIRKAEKREARKGAREIGEVM
ncbi:uncharacterized protein MKZ38_007682 [Zalerion maritima]|uniref:Genetic interactor of prohibitins 3, mitochondrial n=1 Tax=Zalerion maritima TaxID=339359 RepID=A0AAD5RYQ4_9PEZI|nr:uncharacterized protein MKZ38_007682 [Zalerion maritima]